MRTEDRVFLRIEAEGFDSLTLTERTIWLIWLFEAELNNGGLAAFLENCSDIKMEVVEALHRVGAVNMNKLLRTAAEIEQKSNAVIEEIDTKLLDYPDNLGELLSLYEKSHESEILIPNNPLAVWEYKKSHGLKTQPKTVTRNIDFEKEAIADKPFSSRECPECGQPVPDYRKSCKKCGYPVGVFQVKSATYSPNGSINSDLLTAR